MTILRHYQSKTLYIKTTEVNSCLTNTTHSTLCSSVSQCVIRREISSWCGRSDELNGFRFITSIIGVCNCRVQGGYAELSCSKTAKKIEKQCYTAQIYQNLLSVIGILRRKLRKKGMLSLWKQQKVKEAYENFRSGL